MELDFPGMRGCWRSLGILEPLVGATVAVLFNRLGERVLVLVDVKLAGSETKIALRLLKESN